jgi:seryl-tRNA synthetase
MLDYHVQNGYREVSVPTLVNEGALFGTGAFPKRQPDCFKVEGTNLYLNPTAEIQVTNLFRNTTISSSDLNDPIKLVAYSRSFRQERGKSPNTYTQLYEFGKVELFRLCDPSDWTTSRDEIFDELETLLDKLGLSWRRVLLCDGELGVASNITYDYEVFAPGSKEWWEVSSVSCLTDFQTRRMNTVVEGIGHPYSVHASGLSIPRVLSAILETHYDEHKGELCLPECLIE